MGAVRRLRTLAVTLLALPLAVLAPKAGAQTGPTVSISAGPGVTEGAEASFTVTAVPTPVESLLVFVKVVDDGDFLALGQEGERVVEIPASAGSAAFTVDTRDDDIDEADGGLRAALLPAMWYDMSTTMSTATLAVADNDTPAVGFRSAAYDVDEGHAVTLALDITLPRASPTLVGITCAAGTTGAGEFSGCPSSVTIPANASAHAFTVTAVDDSDVELTETFTVTVSSVPGGVRIGAPRRATVAVVDDDAPAASCTNCVWLTGGEPVTEGGDAVFTVRAHPAPTSDLAVDLDVSASRGLRSSFVLGRHLGPRQVTIPSGATSATLAVPTDDDALDETEGHVRVRLSGIGPHPGSAIGRVPGRLYIAAHPTQASVTVTDNDEPPPSVSVSFGKSAVFVDEDGGTASLELALSQPRSETTAVTVTAMPGTATAGADYGTVPATVTFAANATTATLDIPITDDTALEDDETFQVRLSGPPAGVALAAPDTATVTVVDNEYTVTLAGSNSALVALEGQTAEIVGQLSKALTQDVVLDVSYSDFSTEAADFEGLHPATVTVPAARKSVDAPPGVAPPKFVLKFPTVNDDDLEDNEVFRVQVTPRDLPDGESAPGPVDVILVDNEVVTDVQNELATVAGRPARVAFEYTSDFSRPRFSGKPLVIDVATATTTGSGAATVGDYTTGTYTITIPPGSGLGWVDIPTVADADTATETFLLNYSVNGKAITSTTTVTIHPSTSSVPAVSVAADQATVTPGGAVSFTVTATPNPPVDLTVGLRVWSSGGRFLSEAVNGKYRSVTVGAATGQGTLSLTTVSDPENATGRISAALLDPVLSASGRRSYPYDHPRGASPVSVAVGPAGMFGETEGQVAAGLPAVTISADAESVTEGGDVTFTVSASPAPAIDIAVNVLAEEEMGAGTDLVGSGQGGTVTIPAGQTSASWTVTTMSDETALADGTVTGRVQRGDGYTLGAPSSVTLALLDDDGAQDSVADPVLPEITVSAGADVTEGGDATFTFTANPAPAADLSVSVAVTAAGDFGAATGSRTVTVPTTGSATLTLATANDDADEPDGSVSVTVNAGEGYTVGDPASGTVAIADDDPAPPAVATVDPALVALVRGYAAETREGQAHVDRWRRVLAAFGDDNGHTPMTAAEAQTHADKGWQRWVPVVAALEALEAAPVPQRQPATLPAVSVSAGADVTEGGDAAFTVTASPAPAVDLAVSVDIAADGDYGITAGKQSVTIPTTGSATLTLATANDDADEPDGSVSVTVAAGNGYTVGDPASGTVAVRDDDAPLPAVTVSAGDAVAEGGAATFTVTASPAPASPLAVSVTVAARGDYGIASGTQTVSIPTTGSATLTLATADDDADEADGAASVTVNAGDGYTVGSPASGSVSIADDDLPPPAVSIAAKAASVTEGGAAAFALTADRAPDADLTVTLSVAETGDGDHVAAADEGPATAVIAKGATEAIFSVATVDDDVDEPDGSVTVTLRDGGGYAVPSPPGNAAAVTVSDDDAAVGPVLSVDDATGQENGRLPAMPFTVRLSAPARDAVRVYVSTRPSTPESATPKVDYEPGSYDLTFRAGETERQVWVMIHDDSHDEEPETFEVVLSRAQGAPIGDGVAVGTIENDDPMPAAWLARFGRAVAEQALDGIAGRMSADRAPGMRGAVAGQALSLDPAANADAAPAHAPDGAVVPGGAGALALAGVAQAFGGGSGRHGAGGPGHGAAGFGSEAQSRSMTAREALLGSSFSLTGATDGSGGSVALWGRTARGGFDGREGSLSLDGTVTTGMLGADHARGKWLVGLALARSEGEGDYRDTDVDSGPDGRSCPDGVDGGPCGGAAREGDGSVEGALTAAIPYAALRASERLRLWGAVGHGTGDVTLRTAMGGSYRSDTAWSMAAAGLRGGLLALPAGGSGPALAVTSDALWTRTSSGRTRDLAASESDATRLRLGLEGSYRMALGGGGSLVPKLEVGARHDGGDAETGFGVELGGGIAWSDPALGLSLDVSGRALVAHGSDDLKDRGCAASLAFDPDPATGRGPSLGLRREFGGRAQGGLDALFQPATLEGRAGGGEASSRWALEAAYGLPAFGGRFTGSPHAGLGFATGARDYSVGWRLARETESAANVSFGVRATRRESDAAAPEHTVGVEMTARW